MAHTAAVILNYNRAADTELCMESLSPAIPHELCCWVADNGSREEDAHRLELFCRGRTGVHFSRSPQNLGFAAGCNTILDSVLKDPSIRHVLLLNNDAQVAPGALEAFWKQARTFPMVAARMVGFPDTERLDNLGLTLYRSGIATNRQEESQPLLGPCGGAAMYDAEMLRDVHRTTGEYFDPLFFMYIEDADLAMRARWLGYAAGYAGDAIVWHRGCAGSGGGYNPFVLYYGYRNCLLLMAKTWPARSFLRNLPWIALMQAGTLARALCMGVPLTHARAFRDALRLWPAMRRKRKLLLGNRRVEWHAVNSCIGKEFFHAGALSAMVRSLWKNRISKSPQEKRHEDTGN